MLKEKKPEKSIFHIWGAGGVGKTTLLLRLQQQYKTDNRIATRRIDCESIRDLDEMRRQIVGKSNQPWEDWIKELSPTKPMLLLFDNVERFERDHQTMSFAQFEDEVLEPLAWRDAVVMVLCSRWELRRFNRFDVRWRTDKAPRELALFSAAQTAALVQGTVQPAAPVGMLGVETISAPRYMQHTKTSGEDQPLVSFAQEVYAYSAGHPLVTVRLAQKWSKLPNDEAEKRQQIGDWLNELQPELLTDVSEPLQNRLLVIATLRGFHISIYRAFMEKLQAQADDEGIDRDMKHKTEGEVQSRINELTATHLVYWSSEDHSYIVAPSVRLFLSRILWLNDPARYRVYHQAAFDVYADKLSSHSASSDPRFFVEALYHLVEIAASCIHTPQCVCRANIEGMKQWADGYKEEIERIDRDSQPSLVEIRERAQRLSSGVVIDFVEQTFPHLIKSGDDITQ
jgi:hypothetical protein